jgi:Na+-driven multidrug efflux pump
MLGLGLPTIIVVMVQIGVSVMETFWVSRLGTDAVAGVTLVAPLVGLMATMSNGGIGGGVASAIARAIGAGRGDEAQGLLWQTVLIAIAFGLVFTVAALTAQAGVYRTLGGSGESLRLAVVYSSWVFAGAIPLWLMNLLSAAMRGAGEVRYPAAVSLVGAAFTAAVSPALIFGWGPAPALGVAGAGAAVVSFYLFALAALVVRLRSGASRLRLSPGPLRPKLLGAILGVGLISAVGTIVANLTTVLVTGAVGRGRCRHRGLWNRIAHRFPAHPDAVWVRYRRGHRGRRGDGRRAGRAGA